MEFKKLWIALGIVLIASFAVLGGVGYKGIKNAPPIPRQVVTTDGATLFTGSYIQDGQNVWQSIGGQEVGTVWGHGAYVAPDWSADYLHRESLYILDTWAKAAGGKGFASLSLEQQAALQARLAGADAAKYLRSGHGDHSDSAGACCRLPPSCRLLRRCLRQWAQRIRHSRRCSPRSREAAEDGGLLLVDGLGCQYGPS